MTKTGDIPKSNTSSSSGETELMQRLCLGRDVRMVEGVERGIGCWKCGVGR